MGLGLRFATLGLQSYHHDEVVTAMRVIPGSFGEMLHKVRVSESTPPLYYVFAWAWSKLFGVGEVGLRSLSALFGAATVPLGYLIGRQVLNRRTGLILAALIAVNPMLIWYSQEARSYALLVFFAALSVLFFLRVAEGGRRLDLTGWVLSSGLALWSHYFALFLLVPEAIVLVVALRGRLAAALTAIGALVLVALPLVPLVRDQANPTHIGWIGGMPLPERLWDSLASFAIGETGHVIAEPSRPGLAVVPLLICSLALPLILAFGSRRERRAFSLAVGLGLAFFALATAAALSGSDYVTERNLLPALIPLLVAVAAGFAAADRMRLGSVAAIALCFWWVAFDLHVDRTQNLRRPDFRAVAGVLAAPRSTARAIVTWRLGADPIRFYLHRGAQRAFGGRAWIDEIDVVRKSSARQLRPYLPGAFREAGLIRQGRLEVLRFRSPRPIEVSIRNLLHLPTGFGVDAVLLEAPQGTGAEPR